jgi:hypothetical protein
MRSAVHPDRPSRRSWAPVRRATTWLAVALAAGLLVGCTGDAPGGEGSPSRSGTATPGPRASGAQSAGSAQAQAPTLRPRDRRTQVVNAPDAGALSVAVSSSVFDAAPVVVVSDRPGIPSAATQAAELGAPLLVAHAGPHASALQAEVDRLGASAVLAVGDVDAALAGTDAKVVTERAELPASAPAGGADLTVLVRADGGPEVRDGAAVATANAQAAGARVVAVRGRDPRADPEAIAALAQTPPESVLAVGGFGPADRLEARLAAAAAGAELPGGGQVLFPGRRLVALYGHPGTAALGVVGEQGLDASIARAKEHAARYEPHSDVPVVPAFEIIATVAHGAPGPDGDYSGEVPADTLRPWVEKAGEEGVYVILDLQPGRDDFLSQAKLYEPLLKLPHVGLALDPEWKLGPGQRPLQAIGGVDAEEVNRVTTWLADLTARERLPQKLVVLHQFKLSMLRDSDDIDTSRDELAMLIHMDGQGAPSLKDATWRAVVPAAPEGLRWWGWKNFYDEDAPMLTPRQTMSKRPQPVMVSYQ